MKTQAERWLRFTRVNAGPARWFRETARKRDYESIIKRREPTQGMRAWADTEKDSPAAIMVVGHEREGESGALPERPGTN